MKPKEPQKVTKIDSRIEELEKELVNKQAQYLRALADYQNLERRTETQSQTNQQNFAVAIFRDLLEIIGDLNKAESFNQDPGLKLILSKFQRFLDKNQLKELNPIGKSFDPAQMECVQTVEGEEDNIVVEVLERGFLYRNELIRPTKVVVSQLPVSPQTESN